jgi:hypothetical protein
MKINEGGSGGDLSYGRFTSELFEKLERFGELYPPRRHDEHYVAVNNPPLDDADIEAEVSEVTSCVWPFLGATDTYSLAEAIAPSPGLIERLTAEDLEGGGGEGSRIEDALGWIHDGVEIVWEGRDADQFSIYCGSVSTAIHRQEVLIEALRALADTHGRIVARARQDLLDLLDAANSALENDGGGLSAGLTLLSTVFAIGATLTTGGAAAGLGIASVLAGGSATFTGGDGDDVGDGMDADLGDQAEDIRSRTIELIEELKTDVRRKSQDLRDVVSRLRDIIHSGGGGIPARDLVPREPNIYQSYEPVDFKLPDYIPVQR